MYELKPMGRGTVNARRPFGRFPLGFAPVLVILGLVAMASSGPYLPFFPLVPLVALLYGSEAPPGGALTAPTAWLWVLGQTLLMLFWPLYGFWRVGLMAKPGARGPSEEPLSRSDLLTSRGPP